MAAHTLKTEVEVEFQVGPWDAAEAFCAMNSGEMARFFNHIANITAQWERPFCFQMQYLTDDPDLSPAGRAIMSIIGDYAPTSAKSGAAPPTP